MNLLLLNTVMSFSFGNVSASTRPTQVNTIITEESLVVDNVIENEPYYMFLMDGKPDKDEKNCLLKL